MGCTYYLDFRQCHEDPEESNYNYFVNMESTRRAIHVGDVPFGAQSGDVYNALIEDIMKSQRFNVEFLLDHYPVSIAIVFTKRLYTITMLFCIRF